MNFLYNLAGNVVSEVGIAPGTWNPSNPSIGWHAGYIYLDQVKLLGEYTNRTTYFAHPDHLGSTRLLTSTGPATRIQSSGGTNTTKYYYPGVCPSVSGTTYTIIVWIKNQGTTSVKVSGNIADGPTIAPGAAQQLNFSEVGNGSSCAQLGFATVNPGDSFDILAYYPLIIPNGGSNLIPSGNQNFTGWSTYQGSSVTVTQQQAAFVYDSMDYLPFGEQIAGGSITPHKFTGKERDSESGLDNFGARFNASNFGRWTSPDRLNVTDDRLEMPSNTLNKYVYGANNPLSFVDPDGRDIVALYNPPHGVRPGHFMLFANNPQTGESAMMSFGPRDQSAGGMAITAVGGIQESTKTYDWPQSADDLRQNFAALSIQTTPEQAQEVINFIKGLDASNTNYKLYSQNCTTVCRDALKIFLLPKSNKEWIPSGLWGRVWNFRGEQYRTWDTWGPQSRKGLDYGRPRFGMNTFDFIWLQIRPPRACTTIQGPNRPETHCVD